MFKINICGIIHKVNKVEIKNQHLFIDGTDNGIIGYTFVAKVVEGEYEFIQIKEYLGWLSE